MGLAAQLLVMLHVGAINVLHKIYAAEYEEEIRSEGAMGMSYQTLCVLCVMPI
jgi:hypothetical protein